MLDSDSNAIDPTIFFLFLVGQLATTRLLLWLDDDNSFYFKALKSHILIQFTACRKLIAFAVCRPFIMTCSFPCLSQTHDMSILVNDDDVLYRIIAFLSAIIPFLFFWIAWAVYRSLCSIVKKKGGCHLKIERQQAAPVLSSA